MPGNNCKQSNEPRALMTKTGYKCIVTAIKDISYPLAALVDSVISVTVLHTYNLLFQFSCKH